MSPMDATITADVLKQAQAMANAQMGEMQVSKVVLRRQAEVYVCHPADMSDDDLAAAVGNKLDALSGRASWYDAETAAATVKRGMDDRPVEMEDGEDGAKVPRMYGPEPMMLDGDALTPPVVTVEAG